MTKNINVGVIGVGHLGRHHARILNEIAGCNLVAIYDNDPATAKKVATEHKLSIAASIEDLLRNVDAVTIAVPTIHHHAIAKIALERGINTLVEKPLTPTLEEAQDLLAIAAKSKAIIKVGHVERFNGAILAIRDLVIDPRFIEVHRLSPFPERSTDIGVILDVMIHDIDILLSLVQSPVDRIDAIGTSIVTKREDIANARLTFKSGCVANVTASRVSYQTMRKIRIFAPDRYISVDYHKQDAVMYRKKASVESLTSVRDIERISPKIVKTEPLRLELEAFIAACAGKSDKAASGEEGRNALEVALEIGKQIRR